MAPPTGPRVARYRARPRRRAHTRPMRDEGEEAADFAVTVARTEAGRDLALLGATAGLAAPAHAAEAGTASHGTGAGGGKVSMNDLTVAGDPSQWGLTTGKDPEFPTTPGVATGRDPELPVSGLTRKVNEYEGQHR